MRAVLVAAVVAVTCAGAVLATSAKADVGTPVQCTSCGVGWTTGPFIRNLGIDSTSDITQRRYSNDYASHIDTTFYVVNNAYTAKWNFNVTAFSTELSYDWLGYKVATDPNPLTKLTGSGASGYYGPSTGGGQSSAVVMEFQADPSITSSGITINGMRACCNTTRNDNVLQFPKHARISGQLYGSGDTVYLTFPGNTSSSIHESLVMWGSGGTGADFDIYVRCGAKPTMFDMNSASNTMNEALHIDGSTTTCASSWYVAVNSYSGAGNFDLMWTTHNSAQHVSLRAGVNYSASSSDLSTITSELQAMSRAMYGATEGNLYISDWTIYNNVPGSGGINGDCGSCGGVTCDACFKGGSNSDPSSTGCNGFVRLNTGWQSNYAYTYTYLVHELGHTKLCVADEYCGAGDSRCTNYNAAIPAGTIYNQSNHCPMSDAQDSNIHNFCTSKNFAVDGFWPSVYNSYAAPTPNMTVQSSSCWNTMYNAGKVTYLPSDTPDNYDFVSFAPTANWVGTIH